jgi:NAD(P)-dependent dehydrogenase (short-subunit alcohol dehydrogenase family)
VLVCNAGTVWNAPFASFPEHGWDKVAALNVKSPFFLAQCVLPLLISAGSAADPSRVINITSTDGLHVALTETYSYSAAKAGLGMITRMLALHLAPHHITVNAIAPGAFVTKMTAKAFEEIGDNVLAQVPLRRYGIAEDIAGVAVFLASRAGAYITGTILPVDGGWVGTR